MKIIYENQLYMIVDKYGYYREINEPKPWGDAADILVNKLNGEILRQFSCRAEMENSIQDMKKGRGVKYREIYGRKNPRHGSHFSHSGRFAHIRNSGKSKKIKYSPKEEWSSKEAWYLHTPIEGLIQDSTKEELGMIIEHFKKLYVTEANDMYNLMSTIREVEYAEDDNDKERIAFWRGRLYDILHVVPYGKVKH